MKYFLALLTVLILRVDTHAQTTYAISGIVKNTKGEKIQSATVFIAGTEKITTTNADGDFSFKGVNPGNYLLVVNMLGYNSVKQAVTIKDRTETVDLVLTDKEIVLNEVVIGDKKQSEKDLKKFTKYFLGIRNNPKLCWVLNPEIVKFRHTDSTLIAATDDFLIIENQFLGYRIKYLLKKFISHNSSKGHFFDGESTFEPLTGSVEQQQIWNKNRKIAYEDSKMHFFRSLYAGTTRKEGFLVYKLTTDKSLIIERNPSDPQQFVTRIDNNFVNVNTEPRIMIVYDKEKATRPDVISDKPPKMYLTLFGLPQNFSLLKLIAKVDSRGSITDYTYNNTFGYWPVFGVSHQLPFEYKPD
ncbi:MAG: hypothetical protein JWQ34_2827 [Mucilaginibacter sp.]|uniref:carboxypeptidase-like regulatory domain-containing protein n=1 Tax=Mucilaginibacter sp. TaxID=1882438 RepID=UPI0026289E3D|nr:carboxypeptidase-like regulatory domain-containing protein [Mucilaginibacter sp.]MDB5004602.1 hypothetical protein [Mucilaginibacter sp.]